MSTALALDLRPLAEAEAPAIEALLDHAFGTDRKRRTAYRLREGALPDPRLSFAAFQGGSLAGLVQCWPIRLIAAAGDVPLTLVGPVAVEPARQRDGLGKALMRATLAAASENGEDALVLIGDPEYYNRFGFEAGATRGWSLPGPFEPHRLLARLSRDLPATGRLAPR